MESMTAVVLESVSVISVVYSSFLGIVCSFSGLRLFRHRGAQLSLLASIEGKVHLDRKLMAFLNPVNEDFCCHLSHLFHGYVDRGSETWGQILGCIYVVDTVDGGRPESPTRLP